LYDIKNENLIITGMINDPKVIFEVDDISGSKSNESLSDDSKCIELKSLDTKSIDTKIDSIEDIDYDILTKYSKQLIAKNINRLSYINSKIYSIATRSLEFNHPIMQLIRIMCLETVYDRTIFSNFSNDLFETNPDILDISTLHRLTRTFYLKDELMMNFYFYKYCQQIHHALENFILNFCKIHAKEINDNKNVEKFVKMISCIFNYEQSSDDLTEQSISTNTYFLSIDDVLIAMIFNVIEYSMNRIFIEHYQDYQQYFPSSDKRANIISRINYDQFMSKELNDIVGSNNREQLLKSMEILYSRFKIDSAPFVECIDPSKMKKCVLTV
jgi:hypothetical protein